MIFLLALLISFVGSLPGLVIIALVIGYSNKKTNSQLKGNYKILTFTNFLSMDLGFLLSSILHLGLLRDISTVTHIILGLSLGLIFYILGMSIKEYEVSKRKYKHRKESFKWHFMLDVR